MRKSDYTFHVSVVEYEWMEHRFDCGWVYFWYSWIITTAQVERVLPEFRRVWMFTLWRIFRCWITVCGKIMVLETIRSLWRQCFCPPNCIREREIRSRELAFRKSGGYGSAFPCVSELCLLFIHCAYLSHRRSPDHNAAGTRVMVRLTVSSGPALVPVYELVAAKEVSDLSLQRLFVTASMRTPNHIPSVVCFLHVIFFFTSWSSTPPSSWLSALCGHGKFIFARGNKLC